jgi:hypothetical protein
MDFLALLEDRLNFLERFYDRAARPFELIQEQIDKGEEPFVPQRPSGELDEPEYLTQWGEAQDSLRLLGQCVVGLLAKALQDYLKSFIAREANLNNASDFSRCIAQYKSDGWLSTYCAFLQEATGFSWHKSPVPLSQLEQIVLTRNDSIHDPVIDRACANRSESHYKKYPLPKFADELEVLMLEGSDEPPLMINVTRQNLAQAIDEIRRFGSFIESESKFRVIS